MIKTYEIVDEFRGLSEPKENDIALAISLHLAALTEHERAVIESEDEIHWSQRFH